MKQKRRKFLRSLALLTGGAGLGAWWLAASERRSARWARTVLADSRRKIAPAPFKPNPAQWSPNAITVCWIGHATVLVNFYGVHILTDPAFGSRIGIPVGLGTAGPKRYIAPALRLKDLPPIDVVLLSHAHMDHMDLASLARLKRSLVITAKNTSDIFDGAAGARELAWGEKTICRTHRGDLEVAAFEVKHWGQRWPSKAPRGYNGYILRREGKALLFGGDTAHTTLFAGLRSHGPFEAAIMPIGAYQPWIWNHCTPEEAVDMTHAAGAKFIVPVHHLTFKLSDEPFAEPMERLEKALEKEPQRIALRQVGEVATL